jgi:hypothetical protein
MSIDVVATVEPVAEMDRLGNEIAELAAHLEAATAHLLELIREFDARGGWPTPRRRASPFSTAAHTFPLERPSGWRATRPG